MGTDEKLATQMYNDVKHWLPSFARKMSIPIKKANAPIFSSPSELLNALKSNSIKANSWVRLECRPSNFGPFMRRHFLSHIVGFSTDSRLGPEIHHPSQVELGILAQITSHLVPVGLYPPINEELIQLCLYPADTSACGFIGEMPAVNSLIEFLPAVADQKASVHSGAVCSVVGVVRCVTPSMTLDAGISIESYEVMRQRGEIWYLDIALEGAEIRPQNDGLITELWGGLYASGHIEYSEGALSAEAVVEEMASVLRGNGYDCSINRELAKGEEFAVFGTGIRCVLSAKRGIYSVHMDAELGFDFSGSMQRFDKICIGVLKGIEMAATAASVRLHNPNDLDFTYTNSAKAFSVLSSIAAENIADPVGLAVRNWHRKRCVRGIKNEPV